MIKPKAIFSFSSSAHPYLFFNEDGNSMTFFGINITPDLSLIDPERGDIIEENIIEQQLYDVLTQQMDGDFLNLETIFNELSR